ncbi:MAG: ABC transporter ATP-binding protein [Flavobacteriales bacterium]|nr:ABC transporter ATP-binding protein [Flavobacteriales bacterium]
MPAAIRTDHLFKIYPGADGPAVDGLSLSVEEGRFYGLLGPNGAGKTTTLSILCGLLNADSGEAEVMGHSLPQHIDHVKPLLGVVPQDIALYDTLTARENLVFFGAMYGMKGKTLTQRATELLEEFGLTEKADKAVRTYSGGMKRRVNLMVGLLHGPRILFLDEPTVGIDVQSRAMINAYLQKLNANGTTIIYTSHHMDEAERLCDGIGIIDRGRLIVEGSPKELLSANTDCNSLEDIFLKLTGKQLRD